MRIVSGKQAEALVERLAARSVELSALEPRVRHIVNDVRRGGDRVLRRYAEKWDGLSAKQPLKVSQDEMNAAWESLAPQLKKALREAAKNIRRFCEWQKPRTWTRTHHGMSLGQRIQPLESVGLLRAGRTLSAGVDGADDGDSGAGGGSEEYSGRVAEAVDEKCWERRQCLGCVSSIA